MMEPFIFDLKHFAARQNHVSCCQLLLSSGADVNAVTQSDQATPLMRACRSGHLEVALLLLKSGANAFLQDDAGSTALHKVNVASIILHHFHRPLKLDNGISVIYC
jgi:ankyrin repeat protein